MPRLYLAASYVQLDQQEDAEWEITELEVSHPEVTQSHLHRLLPIRDEELRNRLLDDLRAADLTE